MALLKVLASLNDNMYTHTHKTSASAASAAAVAAKSLASCVAVSLSWIIGLGPGFVNTPLHGGLDEQLYLALSLRARVWA